MYYLSGNKNTTDMVTLTLPEAITSVKEAAAFMDLLHANNLMYHCEDDATDCLDGLVSREQAEQINKLMDDIYNLPGNEDRMVLATFDPCGYALDLLGLNTDEPAE